MEFRETRGLLLWCFVHVGLWHKLSHCQSHVGATLVKWSQSPCYKGLDVWPCNSEVYVLSTRIKVFLPLITFFHVFSHSQYSVWTSGMYQTSIVFGLGDKTKYSFRKADGCWWHCHGYHQHLRSRFVGGYHISKHVPAYVMPWGCPPEFRWSWPQCCWGCFQSWCQDHTCIGSWKWSRFQCNHGRFEENWDGKLSDRLYHYYSTGKYRHSIKRRYSYQQVEGIHQYDGEATAVSGRHMEIYRSVCAWL